MLRLLYTSTKTVPNCNTFSHLAWMASLDAFALVADGSKKLFLDGSCIHLGSHPGTIGFFSMPGGQAIYDGIYNTVWRVDEITFQLDPNQVLFSKAGLPGGTGCFCDPDNDLFLNKVGGSLEYWQISTATKLATQAVIAGVVIDALSYAGPGKVMALDHDTGKLALVDYLAREVLLASRIDPCRLAAVSPLHNVVVALGTDNKVRVYALEALSAILSNPEFVPYSPHVHRLMGYPVRVRLTGSGGEACPGYWVQWSLLGEPPKGQLEKEYTRTDAEGYATNFWFGPSGLAETGQETIKAAVTV